MIQRNDVENKVNLSALTHNLLYTGDYRKISFKRSPRVAGTARVAGECRWGGRLDRLLLFENWPPWPKRSGIRVLQRE